MIDEIIDGLGKYLFGKASRKAKYRAKICDGCEFKKKGRHKVIMPDFSIKEVEGHYCGVCKCSLSLKVRSQKSKCPKGKW